MPDSVDRPAPLRTVMFPPRSSSNSRSYAACSGAVVNAVSTSVSMRRARARRPAIPRSTVHGTSSGQTRHTHLTDRHTEDVFRPKPAHAPSHPPYPGRLPAKRVRRSQPATHTPHGPDDSAIPRSHGDSKSGQPITRRYKLLGMIDAAGLRVMRAIADEGSFTGAAVSMGYSQPTICEMAG